MSERDETSEPMRCAHPLKRRVGVAVDRVVDVILPPLCAGIIVAAVLWTVMVIVQAAYDAWR